MRVMSLFAGIGGFDLAGRQMGWHTRVMVEKDPFCQLVLKKNFPEAEIYGDIKEFDGRPFNGHIDLVCGGFPCQPYSIAGKRKGKEDERHLWPEMLRVIRDVQPCWIVGENVFGFLNWNGGLVFREVCADLEAEGYEVQTFVLPAAGVGALHERKRVWIIAHANSKRLHQDTVLRRKLAENKFQFIAAFGRLLAAVKLWRSPEPRSKRSFDGLPRGLDECRLKSLGNAVVPQVVLPIFKAIQLTENHEKACSKGYAH